MAVAAVTAEGRSSSAGGLFAWALGPVAALALLWVVLFATPGSHCEFDASVPTYAVVLIYAVAAAGSLGCLVAAAHCVAALRNGPSGLSSGQLNLAVVAVVALVLVDALLPIAGHTAFYWRLCVVCIPATAVLLLALLAAALLRRTREDVGLLLPAYLIGAAVFVYPSVAVVTIGLKNGALC